MNNRCRFCLIGIIFLCCAFSTEQQDCYKEFDRIMSYYKDVDYENFHMAYSVSSVMNGTEGDVLNNELIKNRSKLKFTNQYMEMYQDAKHLLVVAHHQKQLIIQNVRPQNKIDVSKITSWYQSPDTLKKYYKPLQCMGDRRQGELTAELKEAYKEKSTIRRMVFFYEPQSGKILRSMVESEELGTLRQEVMNIVKFKSGNVSEAFPGTVVELTAKNSKWKEKYKTYKIIDLRSK